MRTIKVYAYPTHQAKDRTSGVDYARVLLPMSKVNGYQDKDVKIEVTTMDIFKEPQDNWLDIAKEFDIVFLNYLVTDWPYAYMAAPVHGNGKKIILDIDDALWNVRNDNVVYEQLRELKGGVILSAIVDDVDYVTTTSGYLRNVIVKNSYKHHEKIKVAGNMIDLDLYNHVTQAKDTGTITLMHFGSTTHFRDLLIPAFVEGVDRIMKDYPNVIFKTVGAFIPELRYRWGQRYVNTFGDRDIYVWVKEKFPAFMDEADIMVVPLEDDIYNRCKSDIKWIEASSAAKPGVWSDTRPYTETIDGTNGFLAKTADDWYENIKKLIDSKELRQKIGMNAYNQVVAERQMKNNIEPYVNLFKEALDIR